MSKASALSTLGNVKAATRSIAGEVWGYLDHKGIQLKRLWGMGSSGSEHPTGRAIDFMITGVAGSDNHAGDLIADYLWTNRKRLRVKWLIWDRRIRSTSPGKSGNWERYNGSNPHTDHVHAFFAPGDYRAPEGSGSGGGSGDSVAGWWHVDPERVSTFLWGLKGGERKNIKAKPRRNIAVVREATKRGKKWLITAHDNWFAKYYMNRGRS